jgi:Ca2+-binding RTX toxin-like protein
MAITLNRASLDFLYRQVTINYLVPDGNGGFVTSNYFNYSALANALDPSGLREVSGSNNNLVGGYWDSTIYNSVTGQFGVWVPGPNTTWGQASQPFLNISVGQSVTSAPDVAYNTFDGTTGTASAVSDTDPRIISSLVATMFTTSAQQTLTNTSFEEQSLADDGPGGTVNEDPLGNYTYGSPTGWTLTGTGGTYAPVWYINLATGHEGSNVAWLDSGATLSQVGGETLVAGLNYSLSLKVGDRTDQPFGGAEVRLIASDGMTDTLLSSTTVSAPAQGEWSTVTLETGAIGAGFAGQQLRVEIENTGGSGQILVDDVSLTSPLTNANPAAAAAATNLDPNAQFSGLQFNGQDTAFIANAGVLGGGRYNGWFVAFGQFFDHGLDFVNRDPDPTATVTINLSPNDPLYDPANGVTSIKVRRADVANVSDAGGDGIFGTADDAYHSAGADGIDGTADDTYSKPQYINQTGLLIDQSQTYGSHQSVNALIREYDANGRPTGRVVSGNTAVLDTPDTADDVNAKGLATWADIKTNALRIGVVLNDTTDLHNAPVLRVDPAGKLMFTPNPGETYTTDQIVGFDPNNQDPNDPFVRDASGNVLRTGQNMLIDSNPSVALDDHIITGDGRANENIGLTAVHHVFHEEHNAQVENVKNSILATGDAAFIAQWQTSPGVWDGEKLYQAARLITESEYNHIAIDQYVGTLYGALPEFVSYSSDINMGVSLEFSQAVFRLGHSMLTETFNVTDPATGRPLRLLDMFLNPTKYQAMLDANGNPADLVKGLVTTLGNEVDEFVTPALQQSLLGQPLDLATINITRGRDVGLPTWNEFRKQVYDQIIQNTNNTNGSALAPYQNWADVFDHLKNPLTGVNLIAAYARDTGAFDWGIGEARAAYSSGTGTLEDIRAAAQALYDAYLDAANPNHAAAVTFMEGSPVSVDGQWVFTGSDQGFWDIDLWIGGLAERPLFDGPLGTTFSYVILDFAQRHQDGDRFYYLYRTPMGTDLGNEIIENQFGNLVMENTGLTHLNGEIFIWSNATFELDGATLTNVDADSDINDYFNAASHTIFDVDGTEMPASAGHLVIAGNEGNDLIIAGLGDDTVYGDAGDDVIQGSQGNDHLFGGDGNDIITDDENDDFISGGAGNDRIFAGPGALDTVFGDEGDDEIHGGDGIDELIGGPGDDMIYGDGDTDVLFGGEGNDYLDGGDSVDEMWALEGNDWLRGGVGDDHLNGGDGNDLLEGGVGAAANDGDRLIGAGGLDFGLLPPPDTGLMDVVSYEDVGIAITADLQTSNENGTGGFLDTYAQVEGLVGSRFNDKLTGAGPDTITGNGPNNMLVGGAGNDILTGLGGDDVLIGDSVAVRGDMTVDKGYASVVGNWKGTGDDRPDYDPSAAVDLGHFLGETGSAGIDTAIFRGNLADYDFETITYGGYVNALKVTDTRDPATADFDGTDILIDMEWAQFADQKISVMATPPVLDLDAPANGNFADDFSPSGYSGNDGSKNWSGSWTETNDGGGSGGGDINVTGGRLHFGDSTDGNELITRAASLTGAASATLSFTWEEDDRDTGEDVLVQAFNGSTWDTIGTLAGSAANGTYNFSQALTAAQIGAGSAIRFAAVSGWGNGENLYIDNVDLAFSKPGSPGNNYSTNFVENGPAVTIAADPTIADDSATIASAKIVLTNAKAGDVLAENGIGGDGISGSIDTSVAGQITLTLTGTASRAAYQAAIGRVTFSNTSDNPDTTPRTIEVTVNDGLWLSNVATTTVNITAVDDPMVANNERVVTNISDGSTFTIPKWALLANDTDLDSALDITSVKESSSGFTAVLAAGGVDITDTDGTNNSFTYTGTGADTANVPVVRDTVGTISGDDSSSTPDILVGNSAGSTFDAGTGNDIVFAGGGDDTIVWNANGGGGTDGRDFVDGGTNGATGDTFQVNGNNSSETFNVYAMTKGQNAGLASSLGTTFNADTEIVITRTVGSTTSVIAELDNIEELSFNVGGGTNAVFMNGDFTGILNPATLTVTGGGGTDTVDVTALTSAHRVVLQSGSGRDNAVGGLGDDVLSGGAGSDTLIGGAGNDTLNGGDGSDVLTGGVGDDVLVVSSGNDTIIVAAGFGNDKVTNFDANGGAGAQDLIDVSALGLTAADLGGAITWAADGADLLVTIDTDGTLRLVNGASANISASDFLFAN